MASSCTTLMSFNPGALWAQLTGSAPDGMAVFEAFPGADAGHAPGRRLAGGPAAFGDVFPNFDATANATYTGAEIASLYETYKDDNAAWYSSDNGNMWFLTVCHVSMFIEFLAFSQHDIKKLRILEIAANLFLFLFVIGSHWEHLDMLLNYECHGIWSIVHIAIIAYRLAQEVWREKKLVAEMSPEDKTLKETWFKHYSNIQFAELRRKYKWIHKNPGESLLTQGLSHNQLYLIFQGDASIYLRDERDPIILARKGEIAFPKSQHGTAGDVHDDAIREPETLDGEKPAAKKPRKTMAPKKHRRHQEPGETFVGEVTRGQYIGEMAYFTKEPATASVRARTTMILLSWDIAEVRHMANHSNHANPAQAEAFAMLPSLFCRDMANRLNNAQNEKAGTKKGQVAPEEEEDGMDDDGGKSIVYHRRVSRML